MSETHIPIPVDLEARREHERGKYASLVGTRYDAIAAAGAECGKEVDTAGWYRAKEEAKK